MAPTPPEGTKISISELNGHELITLPHTKGSAMRYFIGIFLVLWLGGWVMGFASAAKQILAGEGGAFLIFWLGGWSLGGVFAAYFAYRLFKSPIPEKLLLNKPNLAYDTGVPPVQFSFHPANQMDFWKKLFAKQKKHEFNSSNISTLKLRDTDSGNRLTIDLGANRIDIGNGITEIEREWLHEYLQHKYS